MTRALIALAAAVLLVGCSGSDAEPTAEPDSPAASSAAPSGDEGLREAAQAYSDAFLTGDSDAAYALLSARCQDRVSASEFDAIVTAAGEQYGSALPFDTFDAEVSGDLARVTYTYPIEAINQTQEPWVREGGEWRQDDC